jgi:hypothetical protein
LGSNFNPRNTKCIPPVEIIARLDLDQTETFLKWLFLKKMRPTYPMQMGMTSEFEP